MSESNESILAWHFLCLPDVDGNYRTQHSNEIVRVGETLRYDGELELCKRGLHASVRLIDALYYSPGPIVCRVRMSGIIIHGDDKLVASERTVIAMADSSRLLHEFACDCAERTLVRERDAGHEPDVRSWDAIAAKRAWLDGLISDEQLSAAISAASSAARSAESAAWSAARSAESAAWSAASSAASSAARSAAISAARSAARSAAISAAISAASSAAISAASSADREWQNETLTERVVALLGVSE
jgi:hypothetical protein